MNQKRFLTVVASICFGLVLTLLVSQPVFGQSVIRLKGANFLPPIIPQSTLLGEFLDDLEARTDGRVKVRYFPGGSLLKAPAMLKGIESGITDIGLAHIEYTRGRFPVMEVLELPLGYYSAWVANEVIHDFYVKFKPEEFDDVKVLWFHGNSPSVLVTTKPVRKLEDLKGMVIRAPGVMGDVVKALGGAGSPLSIVEVYDGLAKNVIDGVFIGIADIKSFKLAEVAKYVTDTRFFGQVYPFYVVMNKRSYGKLPADVKEVFDTLTGEYKEKYHLMWNAIDFGFKADAEKHGVEMIKLSQAERARWTKALEPVIEDYVSRMVKKGRSEQEVRGWIDYIHKRTDYLIQKQKYYHIESF